MKKKTFPYFYHGVKQKTFCSAVVAGGLVYCSGMSGRLPETGAVRNSDAGQQTVDALDKVKHNLEEAGTSLKNIVRLNVYVKNTERDRDKIEKAWIGYLQKYAPDLVENPPAQTWIGVDHLYYPDMLIEFEATALLPE